MNYLMKKAVNLNGRHDAGAFGHRLRPSARFLSQVKSMKT